MRDRAGPLRITHHASRIILPLLLFAALATAFLAPVLFGDRALLPTGLLMQMSPWAEETGGERQTGGRGDGATGGESQDLSLPLPNRPVAPSPRPPVAEAQPWNPILWDAIAQFYPWRAFAAHWMRRGTIPLWDPHQFCGTPFLANSQSAVLYPLHLLLLYLPVGLPVARAMALLAATHLTLAGFLTYLWLRALRLSSFAAILGGLTFMFSGFAVTWLELPSFITVGCWLPLLFLTIHRAAELPTAPRIAGVAAAVGLTLLGGHLQIAFYCLLGAALYFGFWILDFGLGRSGAIQNPESKIQNRAGAMVMAGVLGVMLAAPHMLPAVELSRHSHRVSTTSTAGYELYIRGAMPPMQLVRLFLPDFYGNPTRGDYIAGSPADYTEFAGYFGGVGLLLAVAGLLAWRRRPRETVFAAILAGFSLLLALGTPLNALFYFGIPGFSQSGSPARVLILFCFAGAWLAALGAHALFETGRQGDGATGGEDRRGGPAPANFQLSIFNFQLKIAPPPSPRPPVALGLPAAALGLWLVLLGGALLAARAYVHSRGADFAPLLAGSGPALRLAMLFALLAVVVPAGLRWLSRTGSFSAALSAWLGRGVLAALLLGELWLFGAGFNPTGPLAEVYPTPPLVASLQGSTPVGRVGVGRLDPTPTPEHNDLPVTPPAGRVLSVNRRWSLFQHPHALLPPNSALALGFSDPQGYDSLFLGRYKAFANLVQGGDTAPPENGNMLFLSNLSSPLLPLLAADRVVTRIGSGTDPIRNPQSKIQNPKSKIGAGWPLLYENAGLRVHRYPDALPRAFVAPTWRPVSDDAMPEELQRLGAVHALGTTALVAHPSEAGAGAGRGGAGRVEEIGPNEVRVSIREGAGPGMLVLLDNYYPGWSAADAATGRSLSLHRVDLTFRGVPVTDGVRSVRFRYEPFSFRFGLYLAMLAIGVLAAMGMSAVRGE